MSESYRVAKEIRDLTKLLITHVPKSIIGKNLESYHGQNISINSNICIYQFLFFLFMVVARKPSQMNIPPFSKSDLREKVSKSEVEA